jgi:hypothetical protein
VILSPAIYPVSALTKQTAFKLLIVPEVLIFQFWEYAEPIRKTNIRNMQNLFILLNAGVVSNVTFN